MPIAKFITLTFPTVFLAGALAACTPQEGEEPLADDIAQSEASADAAEYEAVTMPAMAQTAWRVLGEDGAIYTTMFDAQGNYRDFKNGEALQSGSWEERNDGKLCFAPADADRIGECWEIGMMAGEDTLRVTSDAGKTIELKKVTYIAPAKEG